jgi:hypothetical protein
MPKTAVNMNETKKKRVKNGMRRMVKRERKMKSNGRRKYPESETSFLSKISASLFPTYLPTIDVSQ